MKLRRQHREGRYAPSLWSPWTVLPLAVLVAGTAALGIYSALHHLTHANRDPLEVIKATIGVAGFFAAVLAGVYAYRKQRLAEGDARRADAEQLAHRYSSAAEQLGHDKPAVRLAGVYAMGRLADDWPEQRQTCINVLCAYLRMPYDPDPVSAKHREGEREVRHTVIGLIRDHLQDPKAATTWCGRDLDFTGAVFDGGNFVGARFTGGEVRFLGARFTGVAVVFAEAEFTGGAVLFVAARFTGGTVSFVRARFTGGEVSFAAARFAGDATVRFGGAQFTGGRVHFDEAQFTGGEVDFDGAQFTGGMVDFDGARFTGGEVHFDGAQFTGGTVSFHDAKVTGGQVRFAEAQFTAGVVDWGPFPELEVTS